MPVIHIVALKFKADLSDEDVDKHFKEDARLKERMPELVIEWTYSKNLSLEARSDVNGGCNWIVHVSSSQCVWHCRALPAPRYPC